MNFKSQISNLKSASGPPDVGSHSVFAQSWSSALRSGGRGAAVSLAWVAALELFFHLHCDHRVFAEESIHFVLVSEWGVSYREEFKSDAAGNQRH